MSGADLAGVVADIAVADLRKLESALERDLLRILLSLDTVPGKDSLVRRQGQTSAAVMRQVQARLVAEGEALESLTGRRAVEAVQAVMGVPPASLPLDVRATLDLIVNEQVGQVVASFKSAIPEMRDAVNRGILSGGSLADVVEEAQGRMRVTYVQAMAAVDAAIMAAGRRAVLEAARASNLDLVYVYVGPRDDKNRPFCRQWVGTACTDPGALNNGQKIPADDYAGGYNCRHSWAPTLVEAAVAEGIRILRPDGSPLIIEV